MANAGTLLSQERPPDTSELEEIAWFTFAEVAALRLPSIARFRDRRGGPVA